MNKSRLVAVDLALYSTVVIASLALNPYRLSPADMFPYLLLLSLSTAAVVIGDVVWLKELRNMLYASPTFAFGGFFALFVVGYLHPSAGLLLPTFVPQVYAMFHDGIVTCKVDLDRCFYAIFRPSFHCTSRCIETIPYDRYQKLKEKGELK